MNIFLSSFKLLRLLCFRHQIQFTATPSWQGKRHHLQDPLVSETQNLMILLQGTLNDPFLSMSSGLEIY